MDAVDRAVGIHTLSWEKFPQWTGDFFVGALAEKSIRRVKIRNGNWTEQQILLRELDTRIRDVRTGPDGNILR